MRDDQTEHTMDEVREAAIARLNALDNTTLPDLISEHKGTLFGVALEDGFQDLVTKIIDRESVKFQDLPPREEVLQLAALYAHVSESVLDTYTEIKNLYVQDTDDERITASLSAYRYTGKIVHAAIMAVEQTFDAYGLEATLSVNETELNNVINGLFEVLPESMQEELKDPFGAFEYLKREYDLQPPTRDREHSWTESLSPGGEQRSWVKD